MNETSLFRNIVHALINPLDKEKYEELRFTRPFFVIVILVVGGFSLYIIQSDPRLREPAHLIPFVAVLILFLAMQWYLQKVADIPGAALPWIFLQVLLAVILVVISRNEALIMALILPLMGEVLGFFRERLPYAVIGILLLLGVAISLMVYLTAWNPTTFWLTTLPLMGFVITFVILFMREAEARQAAQESAKELREANRQVIEYASKIEDLTLAAERERLARELHDTLSQGLSGLVLQLDAAQAHLESGSPQRAEEILRDAMSRARQALADSRHAITHLRAAEEEGQDLKSRLLREVTRFSMSTGIPCDFDYQLANDPPAASADHLLRIAAEGLNNIARHAYASRAQVSFTLHGPSIVLEVRDDGAGFDPSYKDLQKGHYGLIGMRERARLLGGDFYLDSAPGRGTTVRVEIPWEVNDP